jgi:transcription termination factor Rho
MNVVEAMELLRSRVSKTKSNAEFLMTMGMG